MRVEDLFLLLDILAEKRGDLVPKKRLVVTPKVTLDHYVTVRVQLFVPDQNSEADKKEEKRN